MTAARNSFDPIPPAQQAAFHPGAGSLFHQWLDAVRDRRTIAAVLRKDLRRHPVNWLFMMSLTPFFGVFQVAVGLHEDHPKTPLMDAYVLGAAVILATTVGQLVMEMEKGSKRLVLLRSLPLTERALMWAKFEGTCLLAIPLLLSTAAGRWWLGRSWLPELLILSVTTMAAAALTFLWAIRFRNRLWPAMFWGTPIFVALAYFDSSRAALLQLLRPQVPVLLGLLLATAVALEGSVRILERRELDF